MAYTKFNDPWNDADAATGGGDESTPLTAAALDWIEAGIAAAAATADAAIPKAISGVATDKVPVYNGSDWVAQKIGSAQLATGISGPRGAELAVASATANVTISATTEGTANLLVTAPAVTFDGSTVAIIEFYCPVIQVGAHASGNYVLVDLYEDGSSIGKIADLGLSLNGVIEAPVYSVYRLTPASGSRTYSIRAHTTNANSLAVGGTAGSGQYHPMSIRILKA